MKLDLNCDLGEGEPVRRTRALMRWITSANVACGGHAGDGESMQTCVRLAKRFGVRLGAHPGPWARADFGRGEVRLTPDQLELLLLQQIGALERIARRGGLRLHHVKLHGALYHASETEAALARRYVQVVARWWPNAKIYARAGGRVVPMARKAAVQVWEEVFADRAYRNDGSLVPRQESGALLRQVSDVSGRVQGILSRGKISAVSGQELHFHPQTLCVHSDSPHALELVRAISQQLRRA